VEATKPKQLSGSVPIMPILFRAYLSSFRIAKAQRTLSDTDAPIADISQLVGFCSQSYFGETFRDLAGMTPRAYRQRFHPNA
jgi:transcriptional regulator GlxA family with amidase domain